MMLPEDRDMLIRIDERTARLVERSDDQESRLRGLEKFRNAVAGVLSILASLLGYNIHTQP